MAAQTPPSFPFSASTILSTRPNTAELKNRGYYMEALSSDSGNIYPTMILQLQSDSTVVRHAVSGGKGPLMVAREDALQGKWFSDAFVSGGLVPYIEPLPGDHFLGCLGASAVAVIAGQLLTSAGDGTFKGITADASVPLYSATAASSAVSNTTTETAFSTGSYTLPANSLAAGDIIRIRGQGIVSLVNSTNTTAIKVKIGSTAILTIPALNYTAGDLFSFDITLVVRTVGASGTFVADCEYISGTAGTGTAIGQFKASTAIDTTVDQIVTVTTTASVANSGNSDRLDVLNIEQSHVSGGKTMAQALEAVDNSANSSTMAYIRCRAL